MAVMLITHAMGVVAEDRQRVVVMYAGKVVEEAPVHDLFGAAPSLHTGPDPLDSTHRPRAGRRRLEAIAGTVPKLLEPPPGCRFAARCKFAMRRRNARQSTRRCAKSARPQGGLHSGRRALTDVHRRCFA
jgi:peptide/nickel transport system ATP-binding protein